MKKKESARRGLWLARAGLLALQTGYLALELTALWIVMGIAEYPAFWSLYAVAAVVASMTGTALLPVIRRYEDWLERSEGKEENCCENDHHAGRCAG
ncbi:hypothetical protein [Faecalibacterium sp. An122]|uniref:hypothetical protein n=1 Tax=Faecalibacterium sp. An122 TaxID=1965551 RepID=UPI000B3917B0|nr:hypothetical protein [Faecalibacterium sp. An122]OUQ35655.1 hypothetical protein B5E67_11710 [Faecalibacterium sp. An122]